MAKEISKNDTKELSVPVVSEAGEQLGTFKGSDLPKVDSEWSGAESKPDFKYVVKSASDDKIVVAAPSSDKTVKLAEPAKSEVVDSSRNPSVEGYPEQVELVTAAGVLPLRDPFQNIVFDNEPKPSKVTPWVKSQVDAGLLRDAVAEDFSDEEKRTDFAKRNPGRVAKPNEGENGDILRRSQGRGADQNPK